MKSRILALTVIIACLLTGCTKDYHEVKKSELERAFMMNSSATFKGYFYQGSDATHHYFVSKWKPEADKLFKIKKTDLKVSNEMAFGEKPIRLFEFKPQTENYEPFAIIGQRTIYLKN